MIQKTKKNDEQNENESPENIPMLKMFNLTYYNWIKSFTLIIITKMLLIVFNAWSLSLY